MSIIQAHPEAEPIRKKGCPIYEQLCVIFLDSEADGKCALSNLGEMTHQVSAQGISCLICYAFYSLSCLTIQRFPISRWMKINLGQSGAHHLRRYLWN